MEIKLNESQWIYSKNSDLTLYWPREETEAILAEARLAINQTPLDDFNCRFEGRVTLKRELTSETLVARANLAWSYDRGWLSGTFRVVERPKPEAGSAKRLDIGAPPTPSICTWDIPLSAEANVCSELIFGSTPTLHPTGAIIVSGATGSGKSKTAQAITLRVIKALVDRQDEIPSLRPPHLVTFEDPIEGWTITLDSSSEVLTPDSCYNYGFAFTPRERGIFKDVRTLSDAVTDAYRQTPTCLYVGEIRDDDNWKDVLNFGASGHLVVATTHASSVRDTMSRILAACRARTPAERRKWIGVIRGLIHIRKEEIENEKNPAFLASVWIGQGEGLNALVSVGLSSVAPNRSYQVSRERYYKALTRQPGFRHEQSDNKKALARARLLDIEELLNQ